ncbi:MAG: cytochrome C peroxidase [Burkholderiales bacterium]|nr:cytochrome C peroxidase [Burkholderiales bacterium]
MHRYLRSRGCFLIGAILVSLAGASSAFAGGNPCNPCAPKNPCAASNRIDAKLVTRPAGSKLFAGKPEDLRREGEMLWNSKSLSSNGLACATCHQSNAAFNASFAKPYPHLVGMVKERSGMKKIALDEMVQFCMLAPMASKPLAWDARELAALTAYASEVQKHFKPEPGSTAAPKNPCAPANPCAAGKK